MMHQTRACVSFLALLIVAVSAAPGDGDVILSPPYAEDPALTPQGSPAGRTFMLSLPLARSAIFNGSDATVADVRCDDWSRFAECCHKAPPVNDRCALTVNRSISVYIPHSYADGDAAPVLLMNDGPAYFQQVSFALDNLISPPRRLPAFVAISVQNGGCDAIGAERGLEYDTLSDRYARFLAEEVLPAVLRDGALRAAYPRLRLSADPDRRAVFGCSSGGAAALTAAWTRPDLFRRVAAYSATLVDQQDHADATGAFRDYPQGAWGYHSGQQLLARQPRPLRVFHSASEFDLGYNLSVTPVDDRTPAGNNTDGDPGAWTDGHHNWLAAGNRTAAALRSAGYQYRHIYARGAHHCDSALLLATLGDTLVWLWEGVN